MKSIEFAEANDTLNPHPNDIGRVNPLPIFRQVPAPVLETWNADRKKQGLPPFSFPDAPSAVVSAWEPTEQERAAIAAGGPVWLMFSGTTHSPVSVMGTSPWAKPEPPTYSGDVIPEASADPTITNPEDKPA